MNKTDRISTKPASKTQKQKSYKCGKCPFAAATSTDFKKHMEAVHLKLKRHFCKLCDYSSYSKSGLNAHIMRHTGEKPFKCNQCSYTCKVQDNLKIHQDQRHSELRPFLCKFCPFQTKTKAGLHQHEKTHFPEKFKTIRCPNCSVLCSSNYKLKQHLLVHSEERPFQCPLCPYKAKCKGEWVRHINIHGGIKEFKCQECGKSFGTASDLKTHSRRRHSDVRPFPCPVSGCASKFKIKALLRNHIRAIHEKERSYHCSFCPVTFCFKGQLEVHIRRHTFEKLFKCPACDYRACTKGNVDLHFVHKHSDSRSFPCPSCDMSFKTKSEFNQHQRVHDINRAFPCKQCSYRSVSASGLKSHDITVHNREALAYQCHQCRKGYYSKASLRVHQKVCK